MSKRQDVVWDQYYGPHLAMTGMYMRDPASDRQATIERMYIRLLGELATNRFKWKGLPDSINPRFLEMTLLRSALSVFYFDDEFGQFFALQGSAAGNLNMYNDPMFYQVYGNQFISKRLRAVPGVAQVRGADGKFTSERITVPEECIPIWANYFRVPDWDIITIYANRLAEFDRTIEINAKNARRTRVAAVDPNQQLSIDNINRQIEKGDALIKVNQGTYDATVGGITSLDLGVDPLMVEKMQISRTRVWNECMGLLGINNANQDKKERLVASEVDANDEQVDSMRWVNLNARRQAAHMINKRWPLLNLSVDFHTQDVKMPAPMTSKGVPDDESSEVSA